MRKALIAAGALTLVLSATACSDDDDGGDASPAGGGEESATHEGGGEGSMFEDAQNLADTVEKEATEAKSSKMEMSMDFGQLGSMQATGEGEYADSIEETKMKMTMDMNMDTGEGGGPQEMSTDMILVDGDIYMKMDGMPGQQSQDGDASWMKMSMEEMEEAGGQSLDQAMQYSDPSQTLQMIQENGEILDTQPDEVDGQAATKYSVELDVQKLLESTGMGEGADVDASQVDQMPMDVWLDEGNLPLQMEMNFGEVMKQVSEEAGEEMPPGMEDAKMTAKYSDWGEPVDIEAPPEDEVAEAPTGGGGTEEPGEMPDEGGGN